MRSRLSALFVVPALVLAALALGAAPAEAKAAGAPGSLTGYGFDACTAPPQAVMDAWWEYSPYSAVGIYIGGSNRLCKDQPELTATGCGPSSAPAGRSSRRTSGRRRAARATPTRCRPTSRPRTSRGSRRRRVPWPRRRGSGSGPAPRSTTTSRTTRWSTPPAGRRRSTSSPGGPTSCTRWVTESGVYSNVAAAISSLDLADRVSHGDYTMPDDIWFAWSNNQRDTVAGQWVLSDEWDDHERVHQYAIDQPQTYGGYTLTVDANWLDVGKGSVGTPSKPLCRGVDVDLRRYPNLRPGSHGPAVAAAQCILRKLHVLGANPTGKYDARTVKAVKKAQRKLDQKQTGKVTRRTWVALLARGKQPLVKVGSTGDPVRRLQRSLSAALGKKVTVDGAFSQDTERAVLRYQRKAGLPATGVVTDVVWDRLDIGR